MALPGLLIPGPLILCLLAALPQDGDFLVPEGFRVTRAAVGGPSFLACCLDDEGRLLLSTERAGILLAEDRDGAAIPNSTSWKMRTNA